ncbi:MULTISPECIES: aromatic ring-hydroxylating oxygenase subunit alpha [Pseudanabaena]|uniref:Rieske (2Fe-2S) iron-sulfur domain protein n=2 Tax=Pseudanabaena TaxID=1152 RepID=L8MUV8_9CYAN|nr:MULTISPECIES: aromatic ring-hydroxylating dioxygenase subunit alpha [Pseudanabaena]ELS30604.1 Rieske (2Fe-2S) iron-sulfur domain protein [Pseudanabaena biceps PCC 7429]MDG3497124.1 aromatic ring-hydroxylating dioxygenase subunit alpha [Pseudanabaena catenata USMAC16]
MLVTSHSLFKRFWYPVIPMSLLAEEQPKSFQLLGQKIVLWIDAEGKPAAALDRCCHRSAHLSLGSVKQGAIACAYHGWQYDRSGSCLHVPQLPTDTPIPKNYRIHTFACEERYGYVWVCMGDPINKIAEIPEASDPQFRLIPEFYEVWNCAGLRVMENEMDLAHPTFVHTTTFGSADHPIPEELEITETDYGLRATAILGVVNPKSQQKNLKMDSDITHRQLQMDWFMPFTCKLRINYPNGLVHIIVNTATPIDDKSSQIVQFCLRNDTEEQTKAADAIAFDRQVTLEDKAILETTDYDVPLDAKFEQHMMTDRPGLLMRRKLAAMLTP